jgi:hypothetical protein
LTGKIVVWLEKLYFFKDFYFLRVGIPGYPENLNLYLCKILATPLIWTISSKVSPHPSTSHRDYTFYIRDLKKFKARLDTLEKVCKRFKYGD